MANKNFLLGRGELLTGSIDKVTSGGKKTPPYDFETTLRRVSKMLEEVSQDFSNLSDDAFPEGKAVIQFTMHPRYISKSDYPNELLKQAGMKAIGGKSVFVEPEQWGVMDHPTGSVTDAWYVSIPKKSLSNLTERIRNLEPDNTFAYQLQTIESIKAPTHKDKIKTSCESEDSTLFEAVLHSDGSKEVVDAFYDFLESRGSSPIKTRVRFTGGVVFIPLESNCENIDALADFSFLRAIRPMPRIRIFRPPLLRSDVVPIPNLPERGRLNSSARIAIFDGGVPDGSPLLPWVNYIEPHGIGLPDTDALAHGEQVTSAFLFGHLATGGSIENPYSDVDHIRVIDEHTGKNNDLELYDVLDRILSQLDSVEEPYHFVNLSLGPNIPVEDDDITLWTAELDQRAANNRLLITVAAGNSGESDPIAGLNRIQPPSDGVNLLAIGACDSLDESWLRCPYSSVGPGRTPGIAKPDGVSFGGVLDRPFIVINSMEGGLTGTSGTSFAAPLTLRTIAGVHSLSNDELSPLAIRALLIHRTDDSQLSRKEVGWGRFKTNPSILMQCNDDEIVVVYQGELPIKEYLHANIPLPNYELEGMVDITATLVIAPEVDPAFSHAYTRSGLEVVFRPKDIIQEGKTYPLSDSFFSKKNLGKEAEYDLRGDGHKWEPCWKATKRKRGSSLLNPCFDIYYHNRNEGHNDSNPDPISYALVVTVKAPKMPNLYEDTLDLYSEILLPIQPRVEVPIKI